MIGVAPVGGTEIVVADDTADRDAALLQQRGQSILWVSDDQYRLFDVRRFECE